MSDAESAQRRRRGHTGANDRTQRVRRSPRRPMTAAMSDDQTKELNFIKRRARALAKYVCGFVQSCRSGGSIWWQRPSRFGSLLCHPRHVHRAAKADGREDRYLLEVTSKFHFALPMRSREKPMDIGPAFHSALKSEYAVRYLEKIGVAPTPGNMRLVHKVRHHEGCAASPGSLTYPHAVLRTERPHREMSRDCSMEKSRVDRGHAVHHTTFQQTSGRPGIEWRW